MLQQVVSFPAGVVFRLGRKREEEGAQGDVSVFEAEVLSKWLSWGREVTGVHSMCVCFKGLDGLFGVKGELEDMYIFKKQRTRMVKQRSGRPTAFDLPPRGGNRANNAPGGTVRGHN